MTSFYQQVAILPQKAECPEFELFNLRLRRVSAESFLHCNDTFFANKKNEKPVTCDSQYILQGLELPAAGLPHYQMPVRGRDGFEEILKLLASQIIDCFHAQTLIRTHNYTTHTVCKDMCV